MARETTETRTFDSEDEARTFAQRMERDFRAYDASARVWQAVDTGAWKVALRMRDSCD